MTGANSFNSKSSYQNSPNSKKSHQKHINAKQTVQNNKPTGQVSIEFRRSKLKCGWPKNSHFSFYCFYLLKN